MFCTECGQSLEESQKFCGSCGSKVNKVVANLHEDRESDDDFDHYAHAFNSIFGTKLRSIDEISDHGRRFEEEILKKASSGDPESLLKVAIIYCTEEENFENAPDVAKDALGRAEKKDLDLGKFWFGYGFALEQVEMFDEAFDAHEKSLSLDFAEAAFNLGRIHLIQNLDLRSAIRIWKIGRDTFNSHVCTEMISDLEVEDGVYSAAVPQDDGTTEWITISDKPGGLGA